MPNTDGAPPLPDTSDHSPNPIALALIATGGALVGWWWQNRAREKDVDERTRVRLRPWGMR